MKFSQINMIAKSIEEVLSKFSGKKRIVLVGKAASGKDYARKLLQSMGYPYQISYTTRPMRKGEIHGIDYYFVPEFKFIELTRTSFFYEYVKFNGWYYGTSKDQMELSDCVFIMTPFGLSHMSKVDREKSLVVYFDIHEEVRKSRLVLRSDADTIDRRLLADAIDFKEFKNFDIKITDPNFK